ncbi:MAG: histone deacetylase [Polyangiaceae bacterium]
MGARKQGLQGSEEGSRIPGLSGTGGSRMPPSMQDARAIALVDSPTFGAHIPPGYHPERPERLLAARRAIATLSTAGATFDTVEARPATLDELGRVHTPAYLESLLGLRGKQGYLDGDTFYSPRSVEAAVLAAGASIALVERLLRGGERDSKLGVGLLRPPGHHAKADAAMGFCLVNNVAVAAAHARASGISRVAVVDFDVHHGNGTQAIFAADPSVLYVSTHQFPFYPGTGALDEVGTGAGKGFTVNVPLEAGQGDAAYRGAFERIVLPVLAEYKPELVLVSAGFDAALRDPLAGMELTAPAYGFMMAELTKVAEAHAGGKIALLLEGGYDLPSLEAGLGHAIQGMTGRSFDVRRDVDAPDLARAQRALQASWTNLR